MKVNFDFLHINNKKVNFDFSKKKVNYNGVKQKRNLTILGFSFLG